MLTDLKNELTNKERVVFPKRKLEFKYNSTTKTEIISEIISEKMMKVVRKNYC